MRRSATATATVVGLAATALASCTFSGGEPSDSAPVPAVETAEPMDLTLLVFNIEYGGTKATDAVIKDLDADVVGVLESYDRLPAIAAATGYPYYNEALQILSRYPILEPAGADGLYSYLEVRPGEAVAMINTHLDYVKDGPNRLAKGVPVDEVLATEDEVRTSTVEKLLPSAGALLADGWPLLFTGDLNQPSHLDWTDATADQHGGVGAVDWPVSRALVGAGLRDAYRETYPDPVTDPGNTWGGVNGRPGSPRRIDYAYVGGPVEVESTEVAGEPAADGVDLTFPRWTSDHRAVLSRLNVTPVPLPATVALSARLVTAGDGVTVTYRLPEGLEEGTITLTGPTASSYAVKGPRGTVEVRAGQLTAGSYDVTLETLDGGTEVANQLVVRPRGARVSLTTDASTYAVGAPIAVSWADGPGNRWDWIGVYRAGAADPEKDGYLVWGYTGGHDAGALPPTTAGELVIGRDHQGRPWPLPPGAYVVHYLLTDEYTSAGSTSFLVR